MSASTSPATCCKMAARASSDLSIDFALPPLSAHTIGVRFSLEPGTSVTPTRCVRTASRTIFTGSCPLRSCRGATGELLSTTLRTDARNNKLKVRWTGSRLQLFPDVAEESGYLLQQSPNDADSGRASFFLEKLRLARSCLAPVLRDIIRDAAGEEGGSSSDAQARMRQQALMSAQLLDEVTEAMDRSTREKVTIDLSTPGMERRTLVTGPGLVSVETTVLGQEAARASQSTRNTDRNKNDRSLDECYPIELYDFEKKCVKPSDSVERMLSKEYERVLHNVDLDQFESKHGDVGEEPREHGASSRKTAPAQDADNDSLKMYRAYHAAMIHRMIRLRDVLGEVTDDFKNDATFSRSSSRCLERSAGGHSDLDAARSSAVPRGTEAERNQRDLSPYGQEIVDYRLEDRHSLELRVSSETEALQMSKYARERSSLTDTILTARGKIIECLGQMIQARQSLLSDNSDVRLDNTSTDSLSRVKDDKDEGKENYEENDDRESKKVAEVKSREDQGSLLSALETSREESEGVEGVDFLRDSIRNVVSHRSKSDASRVSRIYVNTRFGRVNKRDRTADEEDTIEDDRERPKNRNRRQREEQVDERLPSDLNDQEQQVGTSNTECTTRDPRITDDDHERKLSKHERKKERSKNRSKTRKDGSRKDSERWRKKSVDKKRSPTSVVTDCRQRKDMLDARNREKSRKRNADDEKLGVDDKRRRQSENQDEDTTAKRRGERKRRSSDYKDVDQSLSRSRKYIEKRNLRSEKEGDDAAVERRQLNQGQIRRSENGDVELASGRRRLADKEREQKSYVDDDVVTRRRHHVNEQSNNDDDYYDDDDEGGGGGGGNDDDDDDNSDDDDYDDDDDEDDVVSGRRRFSEQQSQPSDDEDDATRASSRDLRVANTDDKAGSRLSRLKDRVKKFYRKMSSAETDSPDREDYEIDGLMLDSVSRRDSTEEHLSRGRRTQLVDGTVPWEYGKRTSGRGDRTEVDDGWDSSLESRGDFRPRDQRTKTMNYRCVEGSMGMWNARADDRKYRRRYRDVSEESYCRLTGLTHRDNYTGIHVREGMGRSARWTNGNRNFVRDYYEPFIESLCEGWNTEVDKGRRYKTSRGNVYKRRDSAKRTNRKPRDRTRVKRREFETPVEMEPRDTTSSNKTTRRLSGDEESEEDEEEEAESQTDLRRKNSVRRKSSSRETEKKQGERDRKAGYIILENNPMQPSIAKLLKSRDDHGKSVQWLTNNQSALRRMQVGTKVPAKRKALAGNLLITKVEPQQCYQQCGAKRWLECGQSSTRNQSAKARPQTTNIQSYNSRDLEMLNKCDSLLEETDIPLNIETPSSYVIISRSQIFNNSVVLNEAISASTRKGPNQIIENYTHTVSPLIVSMSDHQRQLRTWERGDKPSDEARISKSVVGSVSSKFRAKEVVGENGCTSVKLGTMNLQSMNIASDDVIKRNGVYVVNSRSGDSEVSSHGNELKTSSLNGSCSRVTSATTVDELGLDLEVDSEQLSTTPSYKCRLFRADKYPRTRYVDEDSTRLGSGSRRRVSASREREAERRSLRRHASRERDDGRSTQRSGRVSRKRSGQSLAALKRSAAGGRREHLKEGVEERSDHAMRVERSGENVARPTVARATSGRRRRKSRKGCNEVTIMKTVFESDEEEGDYVARREGTRTASDKTLREREDGLPRSSLDSHGSRDFSNQSADSFRNASTVDRDASSKDVADGYYRPRLDADYKDERTSTMNTYSRHLCANTDRLYPRLEENYVDKQGGPLRSRGKADRKVSEEMDRLSITSADSLSVESLQKVVDRVNTIMRARWLRTSNDDC